MTKLSVVAAPSPVPVRKPISGPREKLELLDQRARAAARIADLEAANARLNGTFETAVKAKAAVDAFEADAAAAMLAWSKAALKREAPTIDSDLKLRLLSVLNAAQDQAHAAASARSEILAAIQREAAGSQALEPAINLTIAQILVAEASGPMLDDLREAVAVAVAKQVRVKAAFDAVISIAHSGDFEAMRPVFILGEELSKTLNAAAAPPAPDGEDDRLAWKKFTSVLLTDPTAEFKS